LVRLPSGRTLCRVYNRRLGLLVADGNICGFRDGSDFIAGCPYNLEIEK